MNENMKIASSTIRILILGLFILLFYGIIVLELWREQIYSGDKHIDKISKQSIRRIRIPAVRGQIYSSDGKLLAANRPSYRVVFHLAEMRQPGRRSRTVDYVIACVDSLERLSRRDSVLTKDKIIAHMNMKPAIPLVVIDDLQAQDMAKILELMPFPQGMEIVAEPERYYPEGKLAAHILGYTGTDNTKSAEDRSDFFYYLPDLTGRNGVELEYDKEVAEADGAPVKGLRGIAGSSLVRVDYRGFVYETISSDIPPQNGCDIVLTLNAKAQKTAENLLEGKRGAMVAVDADTGAVIAMASAPSYNINRFVPRILNKDMNALLSDPGHPLLNRTCMGSYTPGSILKPLISLSLLENGMSPDETVTCDGGTNIGNARIKCASWRRGGHGTVDLYHAIEQSCNDFFIEKGLHLGLDKIAETLQASGIGRKTGFSLPESRGLLPSRKYKEDYYKSKWNEYDTGLLSIGQGIILITPLQAAIYTAAIANGGTLWRPYILWQVKDTEGNLIFTQKPKETGKLPASLANIETVRKGMHLVVNAPDGSGKLAKNNTIELYGKTGTAEVGPAGNKRTNTWFICFGKYKDKTYAVSVFIENGDSGGRSCAPLAAKFFEGFLPGPEDKED